jgi:uncharacterized protein
MRIFHHRILLILLVQAAAIIAADTPDRHLMLPMTDGVRLATDVYLPDMKEPAPAILVRSTYGRQPAPIDYVRRGYALVVQDVRGMGGSEGEAHVFYADGWRPALTDGADTVAWIHNQPWCNGKTGTAGGSALGITQMLLAPATDQVAAQVIDVAPADFYTETAYPGGVFRKSLIEGWLRHIKQPHIIPVWKKHTVKDHFWEYMDTLAKAGGITAPALFNGGWYDIFQQGTINAFMAREKHGGKGAKGNNWLIMRWAAHGPDDERDYTFHENRFDVKVTRVRHAFLDAWLKGDTKALKKIPKVHYYVMGADTGGAPGNTWRTAETWPPFKTAIRNGYLHPGGVISESAPEEKTASKSFLFDPENPVPTHGGANLLIPSGPFDQRAISADRVDILKFYSDPLEKPLEITGRIKLQLHVATDAPDTDFTAKLLDVYPEADGRELLMLDAIQRVKLRNGPKAPVPLIGSAEEIIALEIDLGSTSWIFNTGHRIGLHISSSNYPKYEVNPNTGADHPGPGVTPRPARNTVYLDAVRPAILCLPVPLP